MGAALKFKHTDIPRQEAERARLRVVHGPDLGSVFVITADQVTIGRGEENDVILADLKTSRKHAEIMWDNERWNVRDLESANGILHNGVNTRKAALKTSDVITLGDTTLEFVLAEMSTAFLRSVPRELAEIKKEQVVFQEQQKRVRALAQIGGRPAKAAGASANQQRSRILLIVGVGVAAWVFLGGDPPPANNSVTKGKPQQQNLANYLPLDAGSDQNINKAAEVFYRQGFREYLDKNYLRAKVQFETALQISPGHRLARLYLENCNKQIAAEVKYEISGGKKDFEAGKLKEAKNHFEAVLRLLSRTPSDPSFVEAQSQLKQVDDAIIAMRNGR